MLICYSLSRSCNLKTVEASSSLSIPLPFIAGLASLLRNDGFFAWFFVEAKVLVFIEYFLSDYFGVMVNSSKKLYSGV